ncbi:MAG: hypothetical protein OHK0057_12380 [Thermoflexibacter sp.]
MKLNLSFYQAKYCLILGIFLIPSCSQLKPDEPEKLPFDPPIQAEMSYIATPIALEIGTLREKVNSSLKEVIVNDESYENNNRDNLKLKIVRMGKINLQMQGNELSYSAPLKIYADKRFETKILGKQLQKSQALTFSLIAKFKSKVDIGQDWKLQSKSTFQGIEWIEKPKLSLLSINFDLTKLVEKILLQEAPHIAQMIDNLAHDQLHLDKEILHIWTELQKPILINRQHKKVWIKAQPMEFTASHIRSDGHHILIDGKIGAMVETIFGDNPTYEIIEKLPPLQRANEIPNHCDLNAVNHIHYADINEILTKELVEKEFNIEGHILKIKNIRIFGNGSFIILRVDVKGDANGTVFLKGKPSYIDDEEQTIHIQDFDFDVHTEEALLKTADWLLHDTFKSLVQEKLHFPLKKQVEKIPSLIYEGIAKGKVGKKIELQLENMQLKPKQIAIHEDGIAIMINMKTDLQLKLKHL